MDTWEEIQSGHSTIKIFRDEYPTDPREWDNLCEIHYCSNHFRFENLLDICSH